MLLALFVRLRVLREAKGLAQKPQDEYVRFATSSCVSSLLLFTLALSYSLCLSLSLALSPLSSSPSAGGAMLVKVTTAL